MPRKWEIPEKKILTISRQNLACLAYDPSEVKTHNALRVKNPLINLRKSAGELGVRRGLEGWGMGSGGGLNKDDDDYVF